MPLWVSPNLGQVHEALSVAAPWLIAGGAAGIAWWSVREKRRALASQTVSNVPADFDSPSGERVLNDISLRALANSSTGFMVDSALLQESERRYHQLFHVSPEALVVIDAVTGKILAANEAFGRLILASPAEVEGAPFTDCIGETVGSPSFDMIKTGAGVPVSLSLRRRDTRAVRCETSSTKLAFQGVPAYLVVIRDITAQEQARESAKKREALLAALASAGEDLVSQNDWLEALQESLPQFAQAADLCGILMFKRNEDHSIDTVYGFGDASKTGVDDVKQHLFDDQCWTDLQEGRSVRNELVVRPGAESLRIEAEAILIESNVHSVLCFARTETQPHFGKAEGDALRGLVELVAGAIERTNSIEAVRRSEGQIRLAQKMEAVGQLAGGISHDFNNLLTALHGYITLAKGSLPLNHPASHSLEQVELAARQAGGVANALLAFTRRSTGDRKITQVSAVIDPALRMVRRSVQKNIEFNIVQTGESPWINCDASQIQQVIIALSLNARDAMPDGGKIDITIEAAEQHVNIIIQDYGAGMRQDVLERLFEPFFTTKPRTEAAGLGLAIAHSIVMAHDGEIQVSSQLGRGSRFTIILPRVPAPASLSAPLGVQISKGAALVIDDNQFVGALVCTALASQRYSPVRATSLAEANHELAQPVSMLIVDVQLPDGNGLEWLANQRTKGLCSPAIFITGDSSLSLDDHPELGPAAMLHKPFKMDDLVRTLKDLEENSTTGVKP